MFLLGKVILLLLLAGSLDVHAEFSEIQISEFMPDPTGADEELEWIELHNLSTDEISLEGWTLSDLRGSVSTYHFSNQSIPSNGYLVLYRSETKIVQNNDSEQLRLTNPSGDHIDTDIYSPVREGMSFALVQSVWSVSNPTPGTENVAPSPSPPQSPSPSPSPTPTPVPAAAPVPIVLSEVLACGAQTEWVELFNPTNQEADLIGWRLQDSTEQYRLLDHITVPPFSFAVLEWSGYFLNNGGDLVRLYSVDGLHDQFQYDLCIEGQSWSRHDDGNWEQTEFITKNRNNEFPSVIEDEDKQLKMTSQSLSVEGSREMNQVIADSRSTSFIPPKLSSVSAGPTIQRVEETAQLNVHQHQSSNQNRHIPLLMQVGAGFLLLSAGFSELGRWYNELR